MTMLSVARAVEEMVEESWDDSLWNQMVLRLSEADYLDSQKKRILGRARKARADRANTSEDGKWSRRVGAVDQRRRRLSRQLRHIHLARCWLMGTPYRAAENRTREENSPSAEEIAALLGGSNSLFPVIEWMAEPFEVVATAPDPVAQRNKAITALAALVKNEAIPEARRAELRADYEALVEAAQ